MKDRLKNKEKTRVGMIHDDKCGKHFINNKSTMIGLLIKNCNFSLQDTQPTKYSLVCPGSIRIYLT